MLVDNFVFGKHEAIGLGSTVVWDYLGSPGFESSNNVSVGYIIGCNVASVFMCNNIGIGLRLSV